MNTYRTMKQLDKGLDDIFEGSGSSHLWIVERTNSMVNVNLKVATGDTLGHSNIVLNRNTNDFVFETIGRENLTSLMRIENVRRLLNILELLNANTEMISNYFN